MLVKSKALKNLSNINHAFFTREGGVSQGIYASLNCGVGSSDAKDSVLENKARAAQALGVSAEKLCTLYQCHTNKVARIETEAPQAVEADAMATNTKGMMLGILTADCVPVLFADETHNVIGAAHAGWKGAISGILQNTVDEMEALGAKASHITAAIGPAIQQKSYEVDGGFKEHFLEQGEANEIFFAASKNEGRYMFNLTGYVERQLASIGLKAIEMLPHDTYSEEVQFFSYRRTCHRSEADYGRQLSAIVLT
jgi:hypothetical protein